MARFFRDGVKPSELLDKGWRSDLPKRGAVRTLSDGSFKLNRYFSPQEHHRQRSIVELCGNNGAELFDLETDPDEKSHLARDPPSDGQRADFD